ncbi:hypothetical protein KCP70_23370 [Salmonella enterica subsp. enterica]|nr:hypothetical protein KCP70_23370 [Salmonella enterica subsp. enterica]
MTSCQKMTNCTARCRVRAAGNARPGQWFQQAVIAGVKNRAGESTHPTQRRAMSALTLRARS